LDIGEWLAAAVAIDPIERDLPLLEQLRGIVWGNKSPLHEE
jgi:hypothetical protein